MAHFRGLQENRTRVILVVYEDIENIELLDEELQAYIKTNNYIKWGEPLFWEKLRFNLSRNF